MSAAVKPKPGSVQRDLDHLGFAHPGIAEPLLDEGTKHREIERLAFLIWQERGCPAGCAEENWFEAERRFRYSCGSKWFGRGVA